VDGEGQKFARLKEVHLLFHQQSVGANVNVLAACDQAFDDFADLRMHERLATGNVHDRRARLFNGGKAFFRRELTLQHVGRVLDLAASRAGQVTAEEHLQHDHQRIALASGNLLLQDITGHSPHLRDWYGHSLLLCSLRRGTRPHTTVPPILPSFDASRRVIKRMATTRTKR
jgi:hypothetical protein